VIRLDKAVLIPVYCVPSIVINEDIYLELLELLELYCELLIARFGLLDQKYVPYATDGVHGLNNVIHSSREPDPAVSEGVCSIIHAAPRTELKGVREFDIGRIQTIDFCNLYRASNLTRYLDAQVWPRILGCGDRVS
jgi:hypothetical protein